MTDDEADREPVSLREFEDALKGILLKLISKQSRWGEPGTNDARVVRRFETKMAEMTFADFAT